jgi:hypothetical protein
MELPDRKKRVHNPAVWKLEPAKGGKYIAKCSGILVRKKW